MHHFPGFFRSSGHLRPVLLVVTFALFLFVTASSPQSPDPERGRVIFEDVCSACHSLAPPAEDAPPLVMIVSHYMEATGSEEAAMEAMRAWIPEADTSKSLLPAHAIERFGPMMALGLQESDVADVVDFAFQQWKEAEKPATHEEGEGEGMHEQHGEGGMGMQMRHGQEGEGMQMRHGQEGEGMQMRHGQEGEGMQMRHGQAGEGMQMRHGQAEEGEDGDAKPMMMGMHHGTDDEMGEGHQCAHHAADSEMEEGHQCPHHAADGEMEEGHECAHHAADGEMEEGHQCAHHGADGEMEEGHQCPHHSSGEMEKK